MYLGSRSSTTYRIEEDDGGGGDFHGVSGVLGLEYPESISNPFEEEDGLSFDEPGASGSRRRDDGDTPDVGMVDARDSGGGESRSFSCWTCIVAARGSAVADRPRGVDGGMRICVGDEADVGRLGITRARVS